MQQLNQQPSADNAGTNPAVGIGINPLWGFSPAIDLQDMQYLNHTGTIKKKSVGIKFGTPSDQALNVLVCGTGDLRHVLKTVAFARRWAQRPCINFYIMEDCLESVCRSLVLLLGWLDGQFNLEIQMQFWLEIWCNTRLRPRCNQYLMELSAYLLKYLAREEGPLERYLDVSHLKYKERDEVEHIIKFWRDQSKSEFDIDQLREFRQRNHYGVRYDARQNLVDWDYVMSLEKIAPIIHRYHYKRWRELGMGFEVREIDYKLANRTIATFRQAQHKKKGTVEVRGFWSDIIISPYIAFGCETYEEDLFMTANNQQVKTAVDVAEFNVKCCLHEYQTGQRYLLPDADHPRHKIGGKRTDEETKEELAQIAVIEEEDEEEDDDDAKNADKKKEPQRSFFIKDVEDAPKFKLTLLNGGIAPLLKKKKYTHLFDRVIVGPSITGQLEHEDINTLLRPGAVVTFESIKFFPVPDENKQNFVAKVHDVAAKAGWTPAQAKAGPNLGSFSFFHRPADIKSEASCSSSSSPAPGTAVDPDHLD